MHHNVVARQIIIRQANIISYSPAIQIQHVLQK